MAANEWHYRLLGLEFGPITPESLHEMIAHGTLGPNDQVRCMGGEWRRVADMPRACEAMAERPLSKGSVQAPSRHKLEPKWSVQVAGRELGPMTHEQLKQLSAAGRLSPSDLLREGANGRWFRAATVPGLFVDLNRSRSVAGQASMLAEKSPPPIKPKAAQVPPRQPQIAATPSTVARGADPTPAASPTTIVKPGTQTPNSSRNSPTIHAATVPQANSPYIPPRPPARPPRTSRIDWSALLSFSGEQVQQGLMVSAAVAVVAGLWFGRGLLQTSQAEPKSAEFCELSLVWNRVVDLQEVGNAPDQWRTLEQEVLPQLNDLQTRATQLAGGAGDDAILAEQILKLVDLPDGPTKTEGLLRRIVSSGGKPKPADVKQAVDVMTRAAQLVHGV